MSQETINIGTTDNDGTGDPLKTAFLKTGNNFTELFATSSQAFNAANAAFSAANTTSSPTQNTLSPFLLIGV